MESLQAKHDGPRAEKLHRTVWFGISAGLALTVADSHAAVFDIGKIEEALASQSLALELFRNKTESELFLHLKVYNPNEEIALSDILPVLENAGFRVIEEHPFLIAPQGMGQVWIRDFKLQLAGEPIVLEEVKPLIEETLLKVWRREVENDRFNTLVLKGQLNSRQVVVLARFMPNI